MNFSDIVSHEELTATVDVLGVKMELVFLEREKLELLRNKCSEISFHKQTRQPERILNSEKLTDALVKDHVKGWSMTYRQLRDHIPMNQAAIDKKIKGSPGEFPKGWDTEVLYSEDFFKGFLKAAHGFEATLTTALLTISNFQPELENVGNELKN